MDLTKDLTSLVKVQLRNWDVEGLVLWVHLDWKTGFTQRTEVSEKVD